MNEVYEALSKPGSYWPATYLAVYSQLISCAADLKCRVGADEDSNDPMTGASRMRVASLVSMCLRGVWVTLVSGRYKFVSYERTVHHSPHSSNTNQDLKKNKCRTSGGHRHDHVCHVRVAYSEFEPVSLELSRTEFLRVFLSMSSSPSQTRHVV